jgi:hypothetical protein
MRYIVQVVTSQLCTIALVEALHFTLCEYTVHTRRSMTG